MLVVPEELRWMIQRVGGSVLVTPDETWWLIQRTAADLSSRFLQVRTRQARPSRFWEMEGHASRTHETEMDYQVETEETDDSAIT